VDGGWDIIEAGDLMEPTATYVYCIVRSASRPKTARAPQGLPGSARLSILPVDKSLWIAVADVPLALYGPEALETSLRDMAWVSDVALAHEAVVEYFSRQPNATIVPMKLFTMFSSTERAIEEMRSRRGDLAPVLKRIAGCEEWAVRISRRPTAASSRGKSTAKAASGAAFLAAKKQSRDDAREAAREAAETAHHAFAALAAIARASRRRDDTPAGAVSPPLLDAAFLVPSGRRARFRAAARRLAAGSAKAGVAMTLTGPWPAYNFVQTGRDT
jgi:hypothetical protein